jgi:hypothetical protein
MTMQRRLYIASRVVISISIFVWLSTFASIFGFFEVRHLPGYSYFNNLSIILFPFAVWGLLLTTPGITKTVRILKWLIGITFTVMLVNMLFLLSLAAKQTPGEGEGMAAAFLFVLITIGALLILIELTALAIAERFSI